jgi:diguanylate cyclase (GGDEF)-like protein
LYLVAFLFLSVKQAVFSTLAIYALLVGLLILPYMGFAQVESSALKALSINITLSHAVYIFCMFGVIKLKQNQKESQLKAMQMEQAANNDGLLGIGNRRLLQAELNSRVAKHTPFSLLLIDIDFFKSINDIHGHLVGDDTLREITQCMKDNLRPQDVLGRWGGEEFLIIANGAKFDSDLTLAERMRKAVENHTFSTVGQVTVSIGVAQFRPNTPLSQTFSEADKALYQAKNAGRNQVVAAA